jgi:hypothetical protein
MGRQQFESDGLLLYRVITAIDDAHAATPYLCFYVKTAELATGCQ